MQTQQFDGPSLAELLTTVNDKYGEDALIVSARKLRKGGVAGFFTREWFEVTVEVPEEPTPSFAAQIEEILKPSAGDIASYPTRPTSEVSVASIIELAEKLNEQQEEVVNITNEAQAL